MLYEKEEDMLSALVGLNARINRRKSKERDVRKTQAQSAPQISTSELRNHETVKQFLDRLAQGGTLYKSGSVYYAV